MKKLSAALAIMLAATAWSAPSLQFKHMPLGNVIRILSARFHTQVTIESKAASPISGDFTGLSLRQALANAAGQSGLEVVPLGKDGAAGYLLRVPAPKKPATAADNSVALAIAAGRRAALLQQRQELLQQANDPSASASP